MGAFDYMGDFDYSCNLKVFKEIYHKFLPEEIPDKCPLKSEDIIVATQDFSKKLENLLEDAFEAGIQYEKTSQTGIIGETIDKPGDVDFYNWLELNKNKLW